MKCLVAHRAHASPSPSPDGKSIAFVRDTPNTLSSSV
ncbi:MAG: hypothetical protein HGA78_03940 [Nitrospirales bacterium]|nr:hypothetical protein [Nitrospirales bacterium]